MPQQETITGYDGTRIAAVWPNEHARYVALLCHGYGEHIGRYDHVADRLLRHGAAVYGLDHAGHGRSEGERVLIPDFERVVDDFGRLERRARRDHSELPIVLIGHSMGGMIAARYAQRHRDSLTALVLSGPVLGRWDTLVALERAEQIPDTPIDVSTLSRDPEVGRAYTDDPLVWHGPFKRPTVSAFLRCLGAISSGGDLGDLPTLWLHGGDDQLVPIEGTREGIERLRGRRMSERVFPGARHEIFNETNAGEVLDEVTAFLDVVLRR